MDIDGDNTKIGICFDERSLVLLRVCFYHDKFVT